MVRDEKGYNLVNYNQHSVHSERLQSCLTIIIINIPYIPYIIAFMPSTSLGYFSLFSAKPCSLQLIAKLMLARGMHTQINWRDMTNIYFYRSI